MKNRMCTKLINQLFIQIKLEIRKKEQTKNYRKKYFEHHKRLIIQTELRNIKIHLIIKFKEAIKILKF